VIIMGFFNQLDKANKKDTKKCSKCGKNTLVNFSQTTDKHTCIDCQNKIFKSTILNQRLK